MVTRRGFLKLTGAGMLSLYVASHGKFFKQVFATAYPGRNARSPGGTQVSDTAAHPAGDAAGRDH